MKLATVALAGEEKEEFVSDDEKRVAAEQKPTEAETTQEKSARLKALRLQEKAAVTARVERATRKAKARRAILD